jgi:hypothetical protein
MRRGGLGRRNSERVISGGGEGSGVRGLEGADEERWNMEWEEEIRKEWKIKKREGEGRKGQTNDNPEQTN